MLLLTLLQKLWPAVGVRISQEQLEVLARGLRFAKITVPYHNCRRFLAETSRVLDGRITMSDGGLLPLDDEEAADVVQQAVEYVELGG